MALLLLNAALILSVLAAVHWYLYRRLVKDVSRAGSPWRRIGTVLVWLLSATTAFVLVAGPAEPPFEVGSLADRAASAWLPVLLYLTLALLLGELVRPLLRRALARRSARSADGPGEASGAAEPGDRSRRLFVARTVAIGATTLAAGGAAAGRSGGSPSQGPGGQGVELSMPFTGLWRARNSPARKVPSHGTDLLGSRYAIDFIAVDDKHRTAGSRSWRTFLATEPPELFHAFGLPVLAPVGGTVVAVHDAEPDHEGRRSQLALVPYMLGQASRLRRGANGVAGNHLIISLSESGPFVALAHLKAGSVRVSVGRRVVEGQHIADCGNSGNSTQPHVHMQAMDSADISVARGLPMLFRHFREWPSGPEHFRVRARTVPEEEAVVEPLPGTAP
ncbi:peptidoglycan DD-metalloendopeptidase family protein [Streptomyces sp. NPDC058092]|uniref:peptidoglycan DD-metalloendopeptidase family protein n=1 Tax=Streptomyces sp. NPDC058092 TaxID=3346336 RepID=UPI0036E79321